MNPEKLTKAMLLKWGGKDVYVQAENIVRKGAVKKAEISNSDISGIIARGTGAELHTKLTVLQNGSVESHCPCYTNRNLGLVCPHIVALGITIMLRHSDPLREQKYQEEQRRRRRLAAIDSAKYIHRSPKGTPAQINLMLSKHWIKEFHDGMTQARLFFLVRDKLIHPSQIPPNISIHLSAQDQTVLDTLEDICEGPPANPIDLTPSDFIKLMISASGKKIAAPDTNNLIYIQKEPVQTNLKVWVNHDSGELRVAPHSIIPDVNTNSEFRYLVHHNHGFVFHNYTLWPMSNVLPVPYHSIYLHDEVIPRVNVVNFLKRDLTVLKQITTVDFELPPELFDFSPSKPSFELYLRGNRAAIRALLKVAYGEYVFLADQPETKENFALPDPEDVLRYHTRNHAEELRGLQLLKMLGFSNSQLGNPAEPSLELVGTREVLNFFGSGYATLSRAGWKIRFSEKLETIFDSLPVITPVVQITKKDDDWFDITFEFETFNDSTLNQSELQRAINRGDSYLEINGETHLIDTNAVESMREVFRDCQSRDGRQSGHFSIPSIYAPFVQSSLKELNGFDVEEPADWREDTIRRNHSPDAHFKPFPLGNLDHVLRPYQKDGVFWLRFLEESGLNGLLADEMGLGKTLQTLTWLSLSRLNKQAQNKPALIICPTSLVENWNREAQKFVPELKRLVISGSDRHIKFKAVSQADIVITSYALLRRDLHSYSNTFFSVVILDEAQHIKNRSTQNAIAAKQLQAHCKLVLTGTPLENSVSDIWSIMDFLMPQYLGVYEMFKANFEMPINNGGNEAELAQAKLRRLLNPFILRRLKTDVAKDLPDKIVKVSFCQLTTEQQSVYNELLTESRNKIKSLVTSKGFERARFEILAMLMKLRQASCHLDLLKNHHTSATYNEPSAKIEAFLEILDEAIDGNHRILVFSQFVKFLQIIKHELAMRDIKCCYLDGKTKNRLEECTLFNSDASIPVFLISLKAGGTGLNLTGADMVIHMDPWWNPAVEDQATDRAHRIGQKRVVYSIKLISEHTVEEKVLEMQLKKQSLINATISASDEKMIQKLSFDDISSLIGL